VTYIKLQKFISSTQVHGNTMQFLLYLQSKLVKLSFAILYVVIYRPYTL